MRIKYNAIKPIGTHTSKAYADICAHTDEIFRSRRIANSFGCVPDKHQRLYGDTDLTTSGHETTHQINSEIANTKSHRDKSVGLYTLDDTGWVIDEPKPLTIQQVAPKIPKEFRGGILGLYQLYCISQASSWGDRPLYHCDEWVAYTNGSIIALQLAAAGELKEARWDSMQGVVYFSMFCSVMYSCVPSPSKELTEFFNYQLARVATVFKESQKYPMLTKAENTALLESYYDSEYFSPFNGPSKLKDYGFDYI